MDTAFDEIPLISTLSIFIEPAKSREGVMVLRSVAVGCVYSACFTQYVFIRESVLGVLRNLEQ